MAHKHSVYDSDTHLRINPTTRTFAVEGFTKNTIVQHDHNSERFTFELPRFIEGHDMLVCNSVQVHYLNVDANTQETSSGVFVVTDLQESPEDENIAIFSWLISSNATKYVGSLNFCIRFACISEENTVDYAWNTAVNTTMRVTDGINNAEIIIQEYADVLEQWKQDITSNIYDFLPEHLQFGSEGVQTVEILPTTELTLAVDDDGGLADPISQAMLTPLNLQEGVEYEVKLNGDTFNCVAYSFSIEGQTAIVLGSGSMIGIVGGNGEPFVFFESVAMGMAMFAYNGVLETATLSISTETEKIKKLDTKYLPSQLQFGEYKSETGGDTLTWDGDTTGLELNNGNMYKVTDIAPTLEELQKGVIITITQTANGQEVSEDMTRQIATPVTSPVIMISSVVKVVLEDYVGNNDIVITKGTYLANIVGVGHISKVKITDYKGFSSTVVKPLETKYLPEHLQFGATKEYGEIMSERELMGGEDDMWVAVNSDGSLFDCPQLVTGGKLTVTYNGTPYETTVTEMQGMQAYGNIGLMSGGADTGEPFVGLIGEEDGMRMLIAMPLDGSTTITMSIAGEVEKVTTLDVKYAPRPFIVNVTNGDVWTADKTYAEIYNAYSQGYQNYARLGSAVINLSFIDDWEVGFIQATANNIWNLKIDQEGTVSQNQLV